MCKWYRNPLVALIGLAATGACGLVTSESPNVDLTALDKPFSIDATAWNVDESAARTLVNRDCNPGAVPDSCAAAAAALAPCKVNTCTASCSEQTSKCQLALRVELWRAVNLPAELPELTAPADASTLDVALEDVTYEVTSNQLSVDTPSLTVLVAPSTVMLPGEDGALRIGTIPAVPAETDVSEHSLDFTDDGKEHLRRRLSNYQVPFNLIVATSFVVDLLSPVPVGKVNANLRIRGRASL